MMTVNEMLSNHADLWTRVGEILDSCIDVDDFLDKMNTYEVEVDEVKYTAVEELGFCHSDLIFDCFACTYAVDASPHKDKYEVPSRMAPAHRCPYCPIDWGKEDGKYIPCFDGLFGKVDDAVLDMDFQKAAEYAYKIADLPLKPEFEEED